MATNDMVLVAGATGQQGGAVARALLRQGVKVRALTRNVTKAGQLKGLGAEVALGDLTNPASLAAALRGVKKMFLVTTPFEAGMDAEVQQGVTGAEAAKAAGVEHLVYTSVGSAHKNTGIPHFETKWKVEQQIKTLGLPATILRPVFFMENFGAPWMSSWAQQGKLVFPVPPDRKLQMVALQDIGAFAAAAFTRPKEFIGQAIDLAGDGLTLPNALAIISKALGKPIQYALLPNEGLEQAVGHDFAVMFRWFNAVGYSVDIPALQKRWGIPLTKFTDVVATAPWAKRA